MVHPYIRRRQGKEKITYLLPRLEPILAETLGVIFFRSRFFKLLWLWLDLLLERLIY